jgi:hypothetical protein
VNEALNAAWGGLVYFTQAPYAYYGQGDGASSQTPTKVEFKQADAVRSDHSGHMLPFVDYEDALAWTPQYLRDAFEAQLTADRTQIAGRWRLRVDLGILTRMLTTTENALGSGYDVPWAIGTGTNVNFLPPQYGSYPFDSSHTHFKFLNATLNAAGVALMLGTMMTELRHHGYSGRLSVQVSETDVSLYTGMSKNFVELLPNGVLPVAGNSNAPVYVTGGEIQGVPGELFGLYKGDKGYAELRYLNHIPTGYLWMGKSFGVNNPNNGITVREHPTRGFGLFANPQVTRSINPELDIILFQAGHGVGTNNRLNGVAGYVASGAASYVNPTIT